MRNDENKWLCTAGACYYLLVRFWPTAKLRVACLEGIFANLCPVVFGSGRGMRHREGDRLLHDWEVHVEVRTICLQGATAHLYMQSRALG